MKRRTSGEVLPSVVASPLGAAALRQFTEARLALGRAGESLPTSAHLKFVGDHARARDAVWTAVDFGALTARVEALGVSTLRVRSRAGSRAEYLRRPDLGRVLDEDSVTRLTSFAVGVRSRVAVVVADGLSAEAVSANAVPVLGALLPLLAGAGLGASAVVLAEQGRVAIGDSIGEALGASIVVLLVGERPGLSAADSLGCYITWEPRVGTPDSRRNCVSNIRGGGLSAADAAERVAWVVTQATGRGMTGVALKVEETSVSPISREGS